MKHLLPQFGMVLFGASLLATTTPVLAQQTEAYPTIHRVRAVLQRVAGHDFNPLRDGFTFDRQLNKHGVASLEDQDWRVRTLAVRDLVRLGTSATPELVAALVDKSEHVRHVAAMTLGILRATNAVPALEKVLREDNDSVVRSQAAIALGQIGMRGSLAVVQAAQREDKSKDPESVVNEVETSPVSAVA